MAVDTNPLNQLKDIHLPDPIGWWPIAPGWYLVALFLFLLFGIVGHFILKKFRYFKPKKQALNLLKQYKIEYENEKNAPLTSAKISDLLRRVALLYYPRAEVAGLNGEEWIQFLNHTSRNIDFVPVRAMLLELPFQSSSTINLNPLFSRTSLWIKQRRKPCLS